MRSLTDDDLPLQCVYRWERERAEQVFLTQPHDGGKIRDWNWAQAIDETRRIANWLKAQNWEPGSKVAILSKNCAWWIMADMAIWMAGYVTVPIYPSLRAASIRQILEHSEAKACFVGPTDEPGVAGSAIPSGVSCVFFPNAAAEDHLTWVSLVAANPPIAGHPTRSAHDLMTIIYTSGTTGVPKGVMHTFGAFAYNAYTLASLVNLTADDRMFSYLPLAHIVERAGMETITLVLGARIFFTEGIDTFVTDLGRSHPTIFLSVPRLLLKFQQGVFTKVPKSRLDTLLRIPILNRTVKKRILRQLGLITVRLAACGAAPLPTDLMLWYRRLGLQLAEGYGLTETLITHLPSPAGIRPGYVGAAIEGVETKLGDKDELLIKSPMNMRGYYKDPEGTAASFTDDGFFRTGDVAHIAPDGQLRIIGRIKEQFKTSKGKYVVPAPIESKLTAHPDVEACCLMGAGMPNPFAVVVLSEEARKRCADPAARRKVEETLRAQMEAVNAQLDPFERLNFVAVVNGPWTVANGLITPTLKIKRQFVESHYQALVERWDQMKTPVVWESTPDAKDVKAGA